FRLVYTTPCESSGRQTRAADVAAVQFELAGEAMKRKKKAFDEFSRHEVYDRASIVLHLFCSFVAEHPVVAGDKALSAEAQKVCDAIYAFYNAAATKLMASGTKKRVKATRAWGGR